MEHYSTITGTYGSRQTPCEIFTCETNEGTWYCVDGGSIVNRTYGTLENEVDVETVEDFDCFTYDRPIYGLPELEKAINS